jgi:hypothetical protein
VCDCASANKFIVWYGAVWKSTYCPTWVSPIKPGDGVLCLRIFELVIPSIYCCECGIHPKSVESLSGRLLAPRQNLKVGTTKLADHSSWFQNLLPSQLVRITGPNLGCHRESERTTKPFTTIKGDKNSDRSVRLEIYMQ